MESHCCAESGDVTPCRSLCLILLASFVYLFCFFNLVVTLRIVVMFYLYFLLPLLTLNSCFLDGNRTLTSFATYLLIFFSTKKTPTFDDALTLQ